MGQPFFSRHTKPSPTPPLETTESQAEHGSADAQFYLGLARASGEATAQDYAQAARWYLKAAQQNHALAQFNLGVMYASGQGVSRSDKEAEVWFGKAADNGDAGAQHNMGISFYRASIRGLPKESAGVLPFAPLGDPATEILCDRYWGRTTALPHFRWLPLDLRLHPMEVGDLRGAVQRFQRGRIDDRVSHRRPRP